MSAKCQFYRNLHTGTFSLRFKGKVIDHPNTVFCMRCSFVVSKKGRERVLSEKRKNVHAYIASEQYNILDNKIDLTDFYEVYYNPYETEGFIVKGYPDYILKVAPFVLLQDNKVYLPKDSLRTA